MIELSHSDAELACGLSIVASIAHGLEEARGDFLAYSSKIAKLPTPPAFASPVLLGIILPSALAMMSALGYQECSVFALSLLFAARVTDSLLSHWALWFVDRPNPGLFTTVLYVIEAAFIAYLLGGEFRPDGIVAGALPFAVTNPLWLRLFV